MTREEIENDIINTLFECTHSGEDDTISDKEFAEVLADKFINHETNLLKEFVEWYKGRLEHIQEHEKELLDDDVEHEYSYLVEYRKGTTDMLDRLLLHIDKNLEKFLEDRK